MAALYKQTVVNNPSRGDWGGHREDGVSFSSPYASHI